MSGRNIESADDDTFDEEVELDPAKVPRWGGGAVPEAPPVPSATTTTTKTKTPPNDCQAAGNCDLKCDEAAGVLGAGVPANVFEACLQACKDSDGGHEHAPGAFMLECLLKTPPNGCGSVGSAWVPDGTWGACCDLHDACYLAGGDHLDRCACDKAMGLCISMNGGAFVAYEYMTAVRKLGCTAFDWGSSPPPGTTGIFCNDASTTCDF